MENEKNAVFSGVSDNKVKFGVSFDGTKENGNERHEGMDTSALTCSVDCEKTQEIKGKETVHVDRESIDGDGVNVDERYNLEFLVGDLVWCKLEHYPWLPGLIYDPSDVSDFAIRFKTENKLLVVFFGDGSCAWCSPSQLVPFVEHYEEMSKQISEERYVYAVDEALKELGRQVELKMICSCVPEGKFTDLARREAMNGGVRPGTLVPNGSIDKLPSLWCDPVELLKYLRNVGHGGPVSDFLQLVLMKSWLAAFSRLKRGCSLPIYQEPQIIEGLEDESTNETNDFSVPISVPLQGSSEEEWAGPLITIPVKGLMANSTKKRKQKSLSELMGEDTSVNLKGKKKGKIAEESSRSIELKQGEDTGHDDINANGIRQASTAKADSSVSGSTVANDGVRIEGVENESTQSIELKKDEDPVDGIEKDSDEKTLVSFISRKRKKSKYLCAPYTVPSPDLWRSYSKFNRLFKSDKIAKSTKVGDVAGQLISSPSLAKCNSAVSEEDMCLNSLKLGTHVANSQKFKFNEKITDNCLTDINASVNQVLAEVQSAAVDILSMDRTSIEPLRGFLSAFRSSTYLDTSNDNVYIDHESGDIVTDLNNAAEVSAQPAAYSETTHKKRSRVTELKKAARATAPCKEEVCETTPDALIISFGSDASLPSKDEIIKTFIKYGSINEDQTKLLHDSNRAQVVFISSSNAEFTFKESIKQCPFSGNHVNYNLTCSLDPSRALESGKTTSASAKKRSLKNVVHSQPTDGDASLVDLIRQNLANMTSMLNQSDGKISLEVKSNMECEIRAMLQTWLGASCSGEFLISP